MSDADTDEWEDERADNRPTGSVTTGASDAASPAAALLSDRYGRGSARRFDKRFAWIAGGVLVAGGLAVLLFGGWQQGKNIEYRDLDYSVIDERTVMVDAQVTTPAGAEAICAIEAISASYATVGWKLIEVPASTQLTQRFQTTVITTSPATTGTVRECWIVAGS